MQHNLCWLCALVFSSHDAASPCSSMHFQQLLFWLVSPYYQFVLDTHCSSKWFIWCFCCLSLFQDLRGVIQATWPAESIHLAVQMPGERLSFLRKKPLFYKSTSTSLHWKKPRKPKRKPEHLKLCLQHQMLHTFSLGEKFNRMTPWFEPGQKCMKELWILGKKIQRGSTVLSKKTNRKLHDCKESKALTTMT